MAPSLIPVRFGTQTARVAAVAFDKDGTLLQSGPFWHAIWRHRRELLAEVVAAEAGPDVATAAVLDWEQTAGIVDGVFDRRGPFCVGPVEENQLLMAGVLFRYLGATWERCRETARTLYHASNQRIDFPRVIQARPGVVAMIAALRQAGVAVGIVTSDQAERAQQTLALIGLPREAWDFFLTPADVAHPKPAPDMVLAAARIVGCEPAAIAVVGDAAVDLQMARAAGAFAVSVPEVAEDVAFLAPLADVVLAGPHEIAPQPE